MKFDAMLKQYILTRYGTLKEFAAACDMSYSTMDAIFRRGSDRTSVDNLIKICTVLGIKIADLFDGRIVLSDTGKTPTEVELVFLTSDNLTIDTIHISKEERETLRDCINAACCIIRRHRMNETK